MCEWTRSRTWMKHAMLQDKGTGRHVFCSLAIRHMHLVCSVTFGQDRTRLTRQWKIPMSCVCACMCVCVWSETQYLACSRADFSRSPGSRSHSHWEWEQSCERTPTQIHTQNTHAHIPMWEGNFVFVLAFFPLAAHSCVLSVFLYTCIQYFASSNCMEYLEMIISCDLLSANEEGSLLKNREQRGCLHFGHFQL